MACDGCYGYEAEAYGEPPAIYEDEESFCPDCGGLLYQTPLRRFECEECGRTKREEYEY
jgi:ribosomal protein S27AE